MRASRSTEIWSRRRCMVSWGVHGLSFFARDHSAQDQDSPTGVQTDEDAIQNTATDGAPATVTRDVESETPTADTAGALDERPKATARHRKPRGKTPAWRRRVHTVAAIVTTVLAVLLVWFGLVGPDQISRLTPTAFVRIPVEGLVLVAVVVVLPRRARWITAAVIGTLLGVVAVVKLVNMGFYEAINRPFNPTADWSYFQSAEGLLGVSIGRTKAIVFLTLAGVVGAAVLIFTPLAVVRLSRLLARHRTTSLRTVGALGIVWILAAVVGVHVMSGVSVASSSAAGLAYDEGHQITAGLQSGRIMRAAAAADPYLTTPGSSLLNGLRGKDVVIAFVESYGQVAVQGTSFSPAIDAQLRAGTSQLNAAGFSSRSAFLSSPTFGGISWLAHSTLESGLWIDNQQTYNNLVTTDRPTLSSLFKRAGWRTVAVVPASEKNWPEGKTFYGYDQIYGNHNVGYQGPNFSYATMPDQYTYSAFQRLELTQPHAPVMAEIDTVSSHTPWAPLPSMVPWNQVGNGSIFDPMPAQGQSPTTVWRSTNQVRAAYARSIQYSMNALISWVQTNPDPNLVMIVLGDHQPATIVSGQAANHNVPISIIVHDPTVLNKISSWGWQDGLLPSPSAPVWQMNSFRDRFLTAYAH